MEIDAGAEFCPHCGAKVGAHVRVAWWHFHRRLYDWTLAWAYRPSCEKALFALSFAESSFFPVPPDVLLIPLVLGNRRKWVRFALLCSLASVLGAYFGYLLGWSVGLPVARWIPGVGPEQINALQDEFSRSGGFYVFIAAFTPIPFKLLTITSGIAKMNLVMFTAACIVGRAGRFFLVALLMQRFGPTIAPIIEKYFNRVALLFGLLLIGGFILLKYVF